MASANLTTPDTPERPPFRLLAIFHLPAISGPAVSLRSALQNAAETDDVHVLVPAPGAVGEMYEPFATVHATQYDALVRPRDPIAFVRALRAFIRDTRSFGRLIQTVRPDVVLVVTTALPAAVLATRLQRVPTVVYVGEILRYRREASIVSRAAGAAIVAFVRLLADGAICCSRRVAAQFPSRRGFRASLVYPGVHPPDAESGAEVQFDDGSFVIGVVGAISYGRGQDLVIRALPAIRQQVPAARCLFVGGPHPRVADLRYGDSLLTLVRQLGVEEAVTFLGPVANTTGVYRSCDVVVNPARVDEAFGRAAVEAIAHGLPVVATRVGSLDEVLGGHALLVEPDDPAALAEAISTLARDDSLRHRLEGGSEWALASYNADVAAERQLSLLYEVGKRDSAAL